MENKQVKILVSHAEKQHVNQLLCALEKKKVSYKFYTLFATNNIPYLYKIAFLKKFLTKKLFYGIDGIKIHSYLLIGLISKFLRREFYKVKYTYKLFDYWVSLKMIKDKPKLVIGYETCNFHTFRKSKEISAITILDLAAVHHEEQKKTKSKESLYINSYKEKAFGFTDYIFVLSSYAKESIIQNSYFPLNKIYILYLGVNHDIFSKKEQYNLTQQLKILFVANAFHHKGGILLVQIIHDLIKYEKLNIELTVVGNINKSYFSILENNVKLISFSNHETLSRIYKSSDLFLFPSLIDSWGQVVIEAMATGTPVLISENTGAKDAVHKGGGFVLPVDNKEAWKDRIKYFYYNREQIEIHGLKAYEVSKEYTWENYHKQVIAAIEDISRREKIKI